MASGHSAAPGDKGLAVTADTRQLPVCWQSPGNPDSQAHSRVQVRRHLWRPPAQPPPPTPPRCPRHACGLRWTFSQRRLADRLSCGCAGAVAEPAGTCCGRHRAAPGLLTQRPPLQRPPLPAPHPIHPIPVTPPDYGPLFSCRCRPSHTPLSRMGLPSVADPPCSHYETPRVSHTRG